MSVKWSIPSLMVAGNGIPVGTKFYRTLTLDQPASDLTNFPVLFSGTYTYLKTTANGGKVQNVNGYDITFYSDAALTTLLNFERVYWSATTGTVEFWIKVPTLTSASALVIYLSYGSTTITTDQQNINGTWNSGYAAVWHLADGTTLSLTDSTSNGLTLTNNNTATATTGKIDGGVNLVESSTQYLSRGSEGALNTGAQSYSIWIKATTLPHAYNAVMSRVIFAPEDVCQVFVKSNGTLAMYVKPTGAEINYDGTGSHTLVTGTWYYVVMEYDSINGLIGYVNGASDGTASPTGALVTSNPTTTTIGYDLFTTPRGWDGDMDEARIENTTRGVDWRAAEYSNQNDPANFYIIGAETPA